MEMASLHTHDTSGELHAERVERATLGQFFEIWGVPFGADRLGPHRATPDTSVRMWVDGAPSKSFERLELRDGQRIVISYGDDNAPAPDDVED